MRLDIYISTDVNSPRRRIGSYHALWVGYSSTGIKLGEDGTIESEYGNQYDLLVMALKEAAGHINLNAKPHVRICCSNGVMVQAIKNLKTWEQRNFRKSNGQPLSHTDDWKYIASRLHGLYFSVEEGRDGKKQVGSC